MSQIFNLNFERWDVLLLSLFPAIVNIIVFIYTSIFLPQNETTRSFSIFVLILGLWQSSESFIKLSQTLETVHEWKRISGILITFVISTGICFVLEYTKWKKIIPANLLFFLIFSPTMVCSFFIIAGLDEYTIIESRLWNWTINPAPSFYTGIIYLWVSAGSITILFLLIFHFWVTRQSKVKRTSSLVLIIGFSVPVIGGVFAEVIIPYVLKKDSIPISNSLITVFSVASLIAIKKYKIFEYSPIYLWGRIKDSMSEGIVILDNSDNVVFANKVFCELIGYRFDEIENRNISEFHLGREVSGELKTIGSEEIQVTARNGTKNWIMLSGSPYLDQNGKTIGTMILLANVNLLKKSEDRLRQKEVSLVQTVNRLEKVASELREIQAIANVGNWEIDFETKTTLCCDVSVEIYGLPKGENVQTFEAWIKLIHPDDLESVKNELERSQLTLCSSAFYHRILCPDKTVKNLHTVTKFKLNSEGKVTGLYGLCHDITEFVGIQEKLRATKHDLKTFIYRSSHDMRTPLTSILGLIELANIEIKDHKSLEYFGYINELTKKMDHLLLTLIQVMSVREHILEAEDIDTGQIICEIINSLKDTYGFDSIKFHYENQVVERVSSDIILLESILFNLIENAIQYHNRRLPEPQVTVRISSDSENLLIEIEDNGIGIKEEDQTKVFDMFFRATTLSKGSGLGLYSVKIGVERLGGSINLQSQEDVGTLVKLVLPNCHH